jgi:hypothetical protein
VPFFTTGSPNNGGVAIAASPAREVLHAQHTMHSSPPGARPLSHPGQYSNFGGRLQSSPQESPGRDRRASVYSRHGNRPHSQHFANPPLPHQPQAHYYGLPPLDLQIKDVAGDGIPPGEGGYFCGLDTLTMAGDEASRVAENVLLVGQPGSLDVFRVERSKLDIVGRLEGLRGAVLGAKILPWTLRKDPLAALRPLVAITLHGPVFRESRSSSESPTPSVIDDSASDSPSRPTFNHGDTFTSQVTGYQTSVEVYSLKEKRKVADLYKSPLVSLHEPIDGPVFQPPPPVGDLVIDAKGKFVVVASGASGEVFVYSPYLEGHENYPDRYRCIGKVWTSVQVRDRPVHSKSASVDGSQEGTSMETYGVPVFSLSDRWLSVTPPASSAHYALNGVALTSPYHERPPGLTHHTAPPQPTPNCTVEAPEGAGLMDRLTREGAQVAIQGARWATEKGVQAFKSYMNKGAPTNATSNMQYGQEAYFPPTHGHNQAQPRQDSTVISVYDLQRLLDAEETRNKNALHPMVTIPAPLGCSYLSFSPTGLMLMIVSKKGDLQDVFDLKRLNYRKARRTMRDQPAGPHIRQVARFPRITVTNVVDVVWSTPRIDKVAVVTEKGTVHMHPMPASAFHWPPARRLRSKASPPKAKEDVAPMGASGAVHSAMQAFNGTAKPWLDAVRTRTNNGGSRFTLSSLGVTPAAGAKSGKAVAAGVGKQINNIRHAGDNKLTLPTSPSGVKSHSVQWLSGQSRGSVALVSGGVLQIWRVQMRDKGTSSKAVAISKRKLVEFGLAPIRDTALPPSIAEQLFPLPGDAEPTQDFYGEWHPRALPSRKLGTKGTGPSLAPLSFSELETNPPYQPFYTDRRVTRYIYARSSPDLPDSSSGFQVATPDLVSNLHHDNDSSPWLFGEDVEAIRVLSPTSQTYDSGEDDMMTGVAARVENKLVLLDGEEEVEQVVVTTRRRRTRREGADEAEEGFFEDDCEVLDFAEDRV